MQSISRNLILLVILFVSMKVQASAGGEEAPAPAAEEGGGHAAPAEGGGAAQDVGSKADREWAKRTSKLNVYESRMSDLTKKIQVLIQLKEANKQALDEKGKPVDPLQSIVDLHKEYKKTVEVYNKEKNELKYRYPEEGSLIERRYVPLRPQTLEQIQNEIGIAADLTETKKKVSKKYSTFMPEEVRVVAPKPEMAESTIKEKPVEDGTVPKKIKLSK